MQKTNFDIEKGFLSLCYHYIRPEKNFDLFPRLLGIDVLEFKNHLDMLKKNYQFLTLNEALNFLKKNDQNKSKKTGMLLTFDDGLSDHYEAAKILHERNIEGVFFLPTCIIDEKLPANPIIIHYGISIFGISKFLEELNFSINDFNLQKKDYFLDYKQGDDIWHIISKIKTFFKYELDYKLAREILLQIYERLILPKFPNALALMHLTENQISEIIEMGHSIGTHSHTHISLHGQNYSKNIFEKELIYPKQFLEQLFRINITSMSYPFGQPQDCFSSNELSTLTDDYNSCFTVNDILNTSKTSPLEIGRYLPLSSDTASLLNKKLRNMVSNSD
jgi:peptidoglycan/xylan/chitin deacetylase (PgdA/CDA1 family)